MENIRIIDPQQNREIDVEILAEEHNHQQAWRIKLKDGKNALIGIDQHGIWQHFDGNEMDSRLISNIGMAIEEIQQRST